MSAQPTITDPRGAEWELGQVARLPAPGDNAAIAARRLDAGTRLHHAGETVTLTHTVLEGHRFAIRPIPADHPLLSWGLPFGTALDTIRPGTYLCNASTLAELRERRLALDLPKRPNFADQILPFTPDEQAFRPGRQVPRYEDTRTFLGYRRGPARGVGTRNCIILLGTTSAAAGYVTRLAQRLAAVAQAAQGGLDGIVAVAHTEGSLEQPNNLREVLRALLGMMVHPNVGAALVAGYDWEPLSNDCLRAFATQNGYPLDQVPHHFLTLTGNWQADLAAGEEVVRHWMGEVLATPRTLEPLAGLKVALQCGGSDAFSGISGNPLAAWIVREVIRHGGSANLAETAELIGAEAYLLQNVADLETVRSFLAAVAHIKALASWHGITAELNVTRGNRFRGLYNIALKSIGAADKRHPDVRLDGVIAYAERMGRPGFFFMDSPGLDLESIAGQVAAGCNLILFITGNGSITNFPFVPTIKIVTTTGRYQALAEEMDLNAGAYLDGVSMDDLGGQAVELLVAVASGRRTAGERAGHSQVQLWRNWAQRDSTGIAAVPADRMLSGAPLAAGPAMPRPELEFLAWRTPSGWATDQVGLILPNSLCSAQVARLAADRLQRLRIGQQQGLSRWVALDHTEGCGTANGPGGPLAERTLVSYLAHPSVRFACLVEHGCEVLLNDRMKARLAERGLDPRRFGWASVQSDGGVARVLDAIEEWARRLPETADPPRREPAGLEALRLGLVAAGPVPDEVAQALSELGRTVAASGGTVVLPEGNSLLDSPILLRETFSGRRPGASLAYGQAAAEPGLHVMQMPTSHWVEILTGMGAAGVGILLAHLDEHPVQGHPMIPLLQVTAAPGVQARYREELDAVLTGGPATWSERLLALVLETAAGRRTARVLQQGNVAFQLARGPLGLSI